MTHPFDNVPRRCDIHHEQKIHVKQIRPDGSIRVALVCPLCECMRKLKPCEIGFMKCESGLASLTHHDWHCPECDHHLTSLYLCPKCGMRYDLSISFPGEKPGE